MRQLFFSLCAMAIVTIAADRADAGIFRSRGSAPYPGKPYSGGIWVSQFPGKPVKHGSSVIMPLSTPTRVFEHTFTGGPGAASTIRSMPGPRTGHPWFGYR